MLSVCEYMCASTNMTPFSDTIFVPGTEQVAGQAKVWTRSSPVGTLSVI